MDLSEIIKTVGSIIVILSAIVSALWVYTKFIVERSILTPAQFDISVELVGSQKDKSMLEILLHLKNLGSNALVIQSLWVDLLHLDANEAIELIKDPEKKLLCGRVNFTGSLRARLGKDALAAARDDALYIWRKHRNKHPVSIRRKKAGEEHVPRGLPVMPYKTFVQPGVEQLYTYVTNVPITTSFIMVYAAFYYESRPSLFQRIILFVSRKLGLIQYSLHHVTMPHTCERVFKLIQSEK